MSRRLLFAREYKNGRRMATYLVDPAVEGVPAGDTILLAFETNGHAAPTVFMTPREAPTAAAVLIEGVHEATGGTLP